MDHARRKARQPRSDQSANQRDLGRGRHREPDYWNDIVIETGSLWVATGPHVTLDDGTNTSEVRGPTGRLSDRRGLRTGHGGTWHVRDRAGEARYGCSTDSFSTR